MACHTVLYSTVEEKQIFFQVGSFFFLIDVPSSQTYSTDRRHWYRYCRLSHSLTIHYSTVVYSSTVLSCTHTVLYIYGTVHCTYTVQCIQYNVHVASVYYCTVQYTDCTLTLSVRTYVYYI